MTDDQFVAALRAALDTLPIRQTCLSVTQLQMLAQAPTRRRRLLWETVGGEHLRGCLACLNRYAKVVAGARA